MALAKQVRRVKWVGGEAEIKEVAGLLSTFVIEFLEPVEEPSPSQPISEGAVEAAHKIAAAIAEKNARTDRFWRAQRMSGLLGDALGNQDPIKIIERHLHLFFDPATRPSSRIVAINSDSGEYVFCGRSLSHSRKVPQTNQSFKQLSTLSPTHIRSKANSPFPTSVGSRNSARRTKI